MQKMATHAAVYGGMRGVKTFESDAIDLPASKIKRCIFTTRSLGTNMCIIQRDLNGSPFRAQEFPLI